MPPMQSAADARGPWPRDRGCVRACGAELSLRLRVRDGAGAVRTLTSARASSGTPSQCFGKNWYAARTIRSLMIRSRRVLERVSAAHTSRPCCYLRTTEPVSCNGLMPEAFEAEHGRGYG